MLQLELPALRCGFSKEEAIYVINMLLNACPTNLFCHGSVRHYDLRYMYFSIFFYYLAENESR
jgi:hypothetical protein